MGFPTANVHPDARKAMPFRGVYAVWVDVQGTRWPGMMNIGIRPTFDGQEIRLEVHLLGFQGNLYGEEIAVEFIDRLRGERRFSGIDALRKQLEEDAARCSARLGSVA